MGATIKPNIWPKKVSPVPAVCSDCKFTQWVEYEEYYDLHDWHKYACKSCGEAFTFNPEFYPTEFPLTEMHLTYSAMGDLLSAVGIEFDDAGSFEPEQIKHKVHRLAGTRYYKPMLEIIEQAETHKVRITWG